MEILFHAHNAPMSDRMRARAERGVRKLAARLGGTVGATIRFAQDGPTRRVEIVLHAAGHRRLVAQAENRYFGNALKEALDSLTHQIDRDRAKRIRGRVAEPRALQA